MTPEWKGEVPTLELLNRLVTEALPLGLRSGPAEPFFQRDIYYDSADWALRRRGVSCRFRTRLDDRRILTLGTIGRWEGGVPVVAYSLTVTGCNKNPCDGTSTGPTYVERQVQLSLTK